MSKLFSRTIPAEQLQSLPHWPNHRAVTGFTGMIGTKLSHYADPGGIKSRRYFTCNKFFNQEDTQYQ